MLFLYFLLGILSLIALWLLFYGICSLLVDTSKEYTENSPFYRFILNSASWVAIVVLNIKIHLGGKEKLEKGQNYLFVSNHRSNLDPILSWYVFREYDIAFISKPENFKAFIFGRIIHRCGFLPINREDPFKAMECINKSAKLLEKGELSVGVYPEGTRNTKDDMLPFHNGVFKIAQKAKKPIAVVGIKSTDKVNENIPFRRTHVNIDVLKVFSVEEISGKRTNVLGDEIRTILEKGLA